MPPFHSFLFTLASIAAIGLFCSCAAWAGKLLFKRDALGWGDVKFLMAAAGFIGVFGALFAMFAGSLFALLWLLFDAWKRGRLRRKFAFGPFLAAGAVLWLLIGPFVLPLFPKR